MARSTRFSWMTQADSRTIRLKPVEDAAAQVHSSNKPAPPASRR